MLIRLSFVLLFAAMAAFSQVPVLEPGVSHDLAIWRAAHYSDVRYKLNLTLEKMSPVLKGHMEIRVKLSEPPALVGGQSGDGVVPSIILDWRKLPGHEKDSTVTNITLNEIPLFNGDQHAEGLAPSPAFKYHESNDHLILPDAVKAGENVIKLDFTSPILTSGSAITRYIDKEDGSEYIYSLFVPSDASTAFPVFDQPDLKARFSLTTFIPVKQNFGWHVISNSPVDRNVVGGRYGPHEDGPDNNIAYIITSFSETKPISTYVFAFAAGPFEQFSQGLRTPGIVTVGDEEEKQIAIDNEYQGRVSPKIYVRKSQAEKFKPHAVETFRLMREGVKYLEGYFDYKFPWPKYDLVLIPEFPFGGMEHAGATFVREQSIIFPTEPTKSDYINRATLIFHETAHQWFGDTVTMKWFDDLWLKEGFANFMAYKAMEKIMPEMNAWKVFYERIKQPAYATDSTKGTTAIYQPIKNLSAAKSAYGNIVYNKAPAFLRQAEFYLGEEKFQTAVRAFLKKHEYGNATWEDLVNEFEAASGESLKEWSRRWVTQRGAPVIRSETTGNGGCLVQYGLGSEKNTWGFKVLTASYNGYDDGHLSLSDMILSPASQTVRSPTPVEKILGPHSDRICVESSHGPDSKFFFSNYQDYGYGIFLLDDKSRDYILKDVQNEKDAFLRSMMYGALWDSVREGELDPKEYVALAIRNLPAEQDENIVASVLGRVTTAINYYLSDDAKVAVTHPLEDLLERQMLNAGTSGRQITFYRSFLNIGASIQARETYKKILAGKFWPKPPVMRGLMVGENREIPIKTKDKFDIVTRLASLGDPEAPQLLADLEKTETSDDAKRYAYAAHAAFATKENREKFWNDFTTNKTISESWIEAAMGPFNSIRHYDLSLPYLQRALAELPNLKRDRKIFFVNGWLGAFIGGQKSQQALDIVNKFLADNPNLDNDLRLKILENVDVIERAVKIRAKYSP